MRIQNLSPLFLILVLVSSTFIGIVPVDALSIVDTYAPPFLVGFNPASSHVEFANGRWWVFFCDGKV